MNGLPNTAPQTHLLGISWGGWYIVTFYHTQRRGRGVYVDLGGCFGWWNGRFFGRIESGRIEFIPPESSKTIDCKPISKSKKPPAPPKRDGGR